MIFSDPVFLLLFLPLAVALHRLALRISESAAQWVLIGSSLVFYGAWDIRWLPLLVATIVLNYYIGKLLLVHPRRDLLVVGVGLNLLPLFIAKYAGWLTAGMVFADIALPLGISFFTFQQIAFLVDARAGKVDRVDFRHYALFVSFFSQLVAGPIVHHKGMITQFRERFALTAEQLTTALVLLVVGLVKKAVIADRLAPYAQTLFDNGGVATLYEAWVGSLAYTFQLLFDFSGYCEIAMGLALLFGYKIPINFLSPYKSASVTEFWRRWHVTLGNFFRAYVYIPLGGNRYGNARLLLALFVTAFISGIWHGAGITFVLWGSLHGAALVIERFGSLRGIALPKHLAVAMTFLFASLAWVLFRSPDLPTAGNVYASLVGLNGFAWPPLFATMFDVDGPITATGTGFEVAVLAGLLWWCWSRPNVHEVAIRPSARLLGAMTLASAAILISIASPSAFLYFDF